MPICIGSPTAADMAIRTDAERAACIEVVAGGEQAVAEIRFGRQAQARNRAALRERERFAFVDVRRMHGWPFTPITAPELVEDALGCC